MRCNCSHLRQASDDGQERSLVEEVRIVKQPTDPRAELLERGDGRLGGALHHLGHAHCRAGLHDLVLLPHGLEQRPHEQPHDALVVAGVGLEVEVGERANGVATGVADGGVGVLEALDDVADDFGEVGGGGVRVGGAGEGEEAEGVLAGGGFWVGGNGVVEGVEEHWEGFGGEVLDCGLEIFDGDLVSVAVGEFREGGQDFLLQLHHC